MGLRVYMSYLFDFISSALATGRFILAAICPLNISCVKCISFNLAMNIAHFNNHLARLKKKGRNSHSVVILKNYFVIWCPHLDLGTWVYFGSKSHSLRPSCWYARDTIDLDDIPITLLVLFIHIKFVLYFIIHLLVLLFTYLEWNVHVFVYWRTCMVLCCIYTYTERSYFPIWFCFTVK